MGGSFIDDGDEMRERDKNEFDEDGLLWMELRYDELVVEIGWVECVLVNIESEDAGLMLSEDL